MKVQSKIRYVPVSRKCIADEEIGNIRIRPTFPHARLRNFSRPGRRPESFWKISFMKCTIDFSPPPPCAWPKRQAPARNFPRRGGEKSSVSFRRFPRRESGMVPLIKILDNAKGIAQDDPHLPKSYGNSWNPSRRRCGPHFCILRAPMDAD